MLIVDKVFEKFYLVIGLGKSGYWAAKFLNSQNKRVIVLEEQVNDQIKIYKKELENIGIEVFINIPFQFKELSHLIKNIECVILSPAIYNDDKTVIALRKAGVKVRGEVSVGWASLKDISWVGITGTNGKTTVTHLLSHILSHNKLKAPPAGNVGIPICKYAYDHKKDKKIDWIIAELSSYQIEIASEIKPIIGIWTTFTPDHLDRHKTLENYFNIKNDLLKRSITRIYNFDDDYLKSHSNKLAKGIWVTTNEENDSTNFCDYWLNNEGYILEKGKKLFHSKILKLNGKHNIQNLLLAIAAARQIGITEENIKMALKGFKQLPHRLETIFKSTKIEIINDSKATNFDSSIAGIKSLKDNQILIAGGIIKNGDPTEWAQTISEKCNGVFIYGRSAEELKFILNKYCYKRDIFIYEKLEELIPQALNYLKKTKTKILLFSPSCSSFDQFKNFEERGDYFKLLTNKYFQLI